MGIAAILSDKCGSDAGAAGRGYPCRLSPQPRSPQRADARRIQLSRRKGAGLPPGAIYMGRSSLWGNLFAHRGWGHARSVLFHRHWLLGDLGVLALEQMGFSVAEVRALERRRFRIFAKLNELRGKDLACWCSLKSPWCYVDSYVEILRGHIRPAYMQLNEVRA